MTAINMGIFNEIANNKADCDLRNIDTDKTDIIIEYQKPTAANKYTWYRLYATGWVEQGGQFSFVFEGTRDCLNTRTLLITMADQNYNVAISGNSFIPNVGYFNIGQNNRTTTTISFYGRAESNISGTSDLIEWQISGRADMTGHEILPQASEGYISPLELLKQVYPIGSVYMGTQATCPLASLFGTWELVSNGKALWTGNGTNANTTIAAGLPNITGRFEASDDNTPSGVQGAFAIEGDGGSTTGGSGKEKWLSFDASRCSNVYRNDVTTVQPPAYVVNVWRRIA